MAANQRVQADSHPFELIKFIVELREQVYRELLTGGTGGGWLRDKVSLGRMSQPALLGTNRRIYDEALPLTYQSHTFDFGIDVHNIAPFFNRTSYAARQNAHRIHMELLRYGTDRPLRSVPGRVLIDNCPN